MPRPIQALLHLADRVEQFQQFNFFLQNPFPAISDGTPLPVPSQEGDPHVTRYESPSMVLGRPTIKYKIHEGGDISEPRTVYIHDVDPKSPQACRAALAAAIRELAERGIQCSMSTKSALDFPQA